MIWDDKTQGWMLTIAAGILGWLVKDFIFGVLAKRDEAVRKEWKEMLTEVWSPLCYWSGVVIYNKGQAGWDGHGLKELEQLLAKAAHLIPLNHYRTLITIVEHCSGLAPTQLSLEDIKKTHDFVYGKIEALNYLLYRKPAGYDPMAASNILSGPKAVFRQLSVGVLHLFIWAVIVGILVAAYVAYVHHKYWPGIVLGAILGAAVLADWVRQVRLHRELVRRLGGVQRASPRPPSIPAKP